MRPLRGDSVQKLKREMASYHLSVKTGARGSGAKHAEYIQRSGAYLNYKGVEELVHTEFGYMPCWAQHSPTQFFRQADLHERINGSSYREFQAALPRELSSKQQIEFVREFVAQEIHKGHPYIWAIHNPVAAMDGGEQPHVHLMYSERKQDGVERNPEQFFKRFNAKYPEKGGCKKESRFSGGLKVEERKSALIELRARFATLQNSHLAAHGHTTRVDHRSLKNQGLQRPPEIHLGPQRSRDVSVIKTITEFRAANREVELTENEVGQLIDLTSSLNAALLERQCQNDINSTVANQSRRGPSPNTRYILHQMPKLILGGDKSSQCETTVLLPEVVRDNMGIWNGGEKSNSELRWPAAGGVDTQSILEPTKNFAPTTTEIRKIVVVEKRKSKARGWER